MKNRNSLLKKKNMKYLILLLLLIIVSLYFLLKTDVVNNYYESNIYTTTQTEKPFDKTNVVDEKDEEVFNFWDFFIPKDEPEIIANVQTLIPSKIYSCTDSDSNSAVNQYFIGGNTLDQDGTGTLDICNGNTLTEQLCDGNIASSISVDCADYGKVCSYNNGKGYCKTPVLCEDGDGGLAYDSKSLCTDDSGTYYDNCGRNNYLNEYYCRNNLCVVKTIQCGSCNNGQCEGLI